jgi:hypothetical protein
MPILQQYYTSYKNEKTGDIGFRIKAMSPGFTPELQTTINSLIDYLSPPSLPSQDLAAHPVALRYAYEGPEKGFLLCSQSCGTDSNGRPGNFFAHTLVIQPGEFTMFPPISFWKSPFWCHEDPIQRPQLISLPTLSRAELEVEGSPDIDFNGIWDFLAKRERRNQLYKVLCAVIHSHKTGKRVIILDTTENVSWWIAAVSALLPPTYRPLLSFATYEHRLRDGRYLITGTTRDWLQDNPGIAQSFFVLDAEVGLMSNVEDSPYAQMAAEAARPDQYTMELLALFNDYAGLFPPRSDIDEQLDLLALYAGLHGQRSDPALSSGELDAIEIALTSFEQAQDRDVEKLNRLQDVLTRPSLQKDARITKALGRIKALTGRDARVEEESGKRQSLDDEPGKGAVKGELANFKPHKAEVEVQPKNDEQDLTDGLQHFLVAVLSQSSENLKKRLLRLQQRYPAQMLDANINHPGYLQKLVDILGRVSPQQVGRMWLSMGRYLEPGEHSRPLLAISLRVVNQLWVSSGDAEEAKELLTTILQAIKAKGKEQVWLQLVASAQADCPYECMLLFYYALVSSLDLDQRLPYREIVSRYYQTILEHELIADIDRRESAEQGLQEIERWAEHLRRRHYSVTPLLQQGLEHVREKYPARWQKLAPAILNTSSLAPLPKNMENQLVEQALSAFSLSQFSLEYSAMYRRYKNHSSLSIDVKATISDMLLLIDGELDKKDVKRLRERVKMLLPDEYRRIVRDCLSGFFEKSSGNKQGHSILIAALFTRNHDYATIFWQIYWEVMKEKLAGATEQFLAMLDFWFDSAPERNFAPDEFQTLYIVHEFFLLLPRRLGEIQQDRSNQEAIHRFNQIAGQPHNRWYPLVQYYLIEKKSSLQFAGAVLLQRVQSIWQREDPDTGRDEKKQEFEKKASGLFEDKTVDQVSKLLKDLFFESPEQLWSYYWSRLKKIVLSNDIELCRKVLSFWFEDSFKKMAGVRYLPEDFFMGIAGALEEARQEDKQRFNEMARLIEETVAPYWRYDYRWYPLIKEYLTGTKSRDR